MAAAVMCSVALTSCSKSNQDLINDYRKTAEEFVQAVKDKDEAKVKKLSDKGENIVKELEKRDLTESEKEEFTQISLEMITGAMGGAFEGMDLGNSGDSDEEPW